MFFLNGSVPFEKFGFFSRRLDESLWSSFCWFLLASQWWWAWGEWGGWQYLEQNQTKPHFEICLSTPFQTRNELYHAGSATKERCESRFWTWSSEIRLNLIWLCLNATPTSRIQTRARARRRFFNFGRIALSSYLVKFVRFSLQSSPFLSSCLLSSCTPSFLALLESISHPHAYV